MMPIFGKSPEAEPSGIRAKITLNVFEIGDDRWPEYFEVIPKPGDMVESNMGRKLLVKEIVHKYSENGTAMIEIIASRELGGSSPIEGNGTPAE